MNIKAMTDRELSEAAAMANYLFDSHYDSCPYCRNRRAHQNTLCTKGQALLARLEAMEAEQEDRADAESFDADQRAERRNEQTLSGVH